MTKRRLDWECGFSSDKSIDPLEYFTATVPGSVQLDYARAHKLGDYNESANYLLYAGLEDYYWTYKTIVPPGENRYLLSNGIDYQYEIFYGNKKIYAYEGMNKGFKILLPSSSENEVLKIVIHPAPKVPGESGRAQAKESCKPAVSYGWDFQARLIPLGIWNDCWLEIVSADTILQQELTYELSSDLQKCVVSLHYQTTGGIFHWTLNGEERSSKKPEGELEITIEQPTLWYPVGYGDQYLYTSKTWIEETEEVIERKVGFRTVKLVSRPNNWAHKNYEGCTQAKPPITLQVNGIEVFAKGSNYVIPDVFYSKMNEEIYEKYINLVKTANFNILRCWGGCVVNKEEFFTLCDEAGIMIIQEFPLSCNEYPDKPEYLNVLKNEATAIVKNLREHASVVVYCGGNELFEGWSMMTEQSKALRLLNSICLEQDENTPFLMSLPIYGVIHGSYGFKYRNMEPQQLFRQLKATAYTEFGVPSLSSQSCFNRYMQDPEASIENHFGIKAWTSNRESWSCQTDLESYLGKVADLSDFIEKSQTLQGMLYKQVFEEIRWQKATASMAINWNLCDSWPTYANNSIIEYGGKPKKALFAIANSLKPQVASLVTDSIRCASEFAGKVGLLNDSKATDACTVKMVVTQNGMIKEKEIRISACRDYQNSELNEFVFDLSDFNPGLFSVSLRGNGYDNEYNFIKS